MLNTIFGIVGWIGTLLVFAGVAIRVFRPEWDTYAYWAAVGGLVCVGLYTLTQWREIGRSFQKRETKLGAMMSISVAAVLAILIGINWAVTRRDKRWDLTASASYTLSDQTVKVLTNLKTPVKVLVFDTPGGFQRFRDSLTMYTTASPNLQVEYVDMDREPARAREYAIASPGTVVMEYDGRREKVMSEREQDLTNNLIKVTTGRQVKAYFVQGHGEKDILGNDRPGYASVVEALKRDNYTVDKIVLAQSAAGVPADASVLIIAGPTSDYLKPEVDAIRTYLRKGGKALFMLDPPVGESARTAPTLEALLKEWGITLGHDVVIDASGMGQLLGTDASVPVVANYPQHDVTQNFDLLTAFPLAQSVAGTAGTELGMAVTANVINTSDRSWSEADVKSLATGGKVSLDEAAGDHRGPITIALSLATDAPDASPSAPAGASGDKPAEGAKPGEKPADAPKKQQMRIMVVGDSDFASNAAAGIQGNADLFVNMNNWLTQQEDLISIHPRDAGDRRVTMTADQQRRVLWLSLLFIPGLILGLGVYSWWQRR
ncbi:MAG TPA: Gldg family protein [Vicinamibacterales bacterium]|nr:Gldg family protein [Vicinamibacterales bacterium]